MARREKKKGRNELMKQVEKVIDGIKHIFVEDSTPALKDWKSSMNVYVNPNIKYVLDELGCLRAFMEVRGDMVLMYCREQMANEEIRKNFDEFKEELKCRQK